MLLEEIEDREHSQFNFYVIGKINSTSHKAFGHAPSHTFLKRRNSWRKKPTF